MAQFTFKNEKGVEQTIDISKQDMELVQSNTILTDQKMQSKPTTFFKDALRRFCKNKSSVAGAIILGVLLVGAAVLPSAIPYDITTTHPQEVKLSPKLFDAGFGWWDGTTKKTNITAEIDWDKYYATGEIDGLPAEIEEKNIIGGKSGVKFNPISYTDAVMTYADGGYIRFNVTPTSSGDVQIGELNSYNGIRMDLTAGNNYKVTIKTCYTDDPEYASYWKYGKEGVYSVGFAWTDDDVDYYVPFAEDISTRGETTYVLDDYLDEISVYTSDLNFLTRRKPHISFRMASDTSSDTSTMNLLIKRVIFETSNEEEKEEFANNSVTNPNKTLQIKPKKDDGTYNKYYWNTLNAQANLFHANTFTCNYTFDDYEAAYGNFFYQDIGVTNLQYYASKGWLSADFDMISKETLEPLTTSQKKAKCAEFAKTIQVLDTNRCPLVIDEDNPVTGTAIVARGNYAIQISGTCTRWKYLYPERTSCPRYLFGTDDAGKDMVKSVFSGLRTSLLLGVLTFAVCFTFGLVWGAIAGYFGGWVDIIMERFTDILGGVPWIVMMTLIIVRLGQNFAAFAIALCLTGWIGTASLTRTQFYRYKDREYILAARTLGAHDMRLIFRHILPNAVGTIITSSVLMIPSVIFDEAAISYLNLGLQDMDSFGVILSQNQQYLATYPFLILFPSVVMALIMISFNLFGNGLRDAFNPSLKGQD